MVEMKVEGAGITPQRVLGSLFTDHRSHTCPRSH